jgi:hypothetical protein
MYMEQKQKYFGDAGDRTLDLMQYWILLERLAKHAFYH